MGNMTGKSLGITPPDDGTILNLPRRASRMGHRATTLAVESTSFKYLDKDQATTPLLNFVTSGGLDHPVGYDAAGNETHYFADRTITARNLLGAVTDTAGEGAPHQLTYGYDGRGVRVSRTESTGGTPATRYYVYSPELQLLASTVDDGANAWGKAVSLTAGLAPNHEIVWFAGLPVAEIGPPRSSSLGILSRRATTMAATNTFTTFTDHLGTPLLQTDASGTVVWRAEHEPYGSIWTMRTGSRFDQPLRLPGQELAMTWEGTEENYNVFRWYRAGWGQYTQPDPIGLKGGTNLFAYVEDDPLDGFDYLGLKVCRCDRRLAVTPINGSMWNPAVKYVGHHSFVEIVPDGQPCTGGPAWGFQNDGTVQPESTPTFDPQVHCTEEKCIDEELLKKNINHDIHHPPQYKWCNFGKGKWNKSNCQGWVDDVLKRSKKGCCP
jgi:RHS repeat-associated protein